MTNNKFPNVITFKQRSSTGSEADYQLGTYITSWIMYVGGLTNNVSTSEFYANVVKRPMDKRPGRTYHKWLKEGALIHSFGFDVANHYIKLPIAWLDETNQKTNLTNNEVFGLGKYVNSTHALIKIKDENYEELSLLINHTDYSNIYAEQYFFESINPPYDDNGTMKGGEFYTAPSEEEA
jgi:hypothetical protein